MKRIVVVGLGNFGSSVADHLAEKRHDVVAVDLDPDAVDRVSNLVRSAVVGDGTDPVVLREIGCRAADVAVVSTGHDITASLLTILALKDLGVGSIYVKVISTPHRRIVEKLGVTETIFPERDSGARLAERLASRAVLNYVPLGESFSLQEMAVPDEWIGKTLRELDLRTTKGVSVVALHDMLRDAVVGVPDPDAPLSESDTLFVAGSVADLEKLAKVR